jgi:hypothetical protein
MISLCGGQKAQIGNAKVELPKATDFAQFGVTEDGTVVPVTKP